MTREDMIDRAVREYFEMGEFPRFSMAFCLWDQRVPDFMVWNIGSRFRSVAAEHGVLIARSLP